MLLRYSEHPNHQPRTDRCEILTLHWTPGELYSLRCLKAAASKTERFRDPVVSEFAAKVVGEKYAWEPPQRDSRLPKNPEGDP
jgi:hypothetical protein